MAALFLDSKLNDEDLPLAYIKVILAPHDKAMKLLSLGTVMKAASQHWPSCSLPQETAVKQGFSIS